METPKLKGPMERVDCSWHDQQSLAPSAQRSPVSEDFKTKWAVPWSELKL